jgi:zinc D-Ala-D-Ala carboxypeptidase
MADERMVSTHFSAKEMNCPCCGAQGIARSFLDRLEELRFMFAAPLPVTSAYRCKDHNEAIKGSENSWHIKGRAVDLAITDPVARFNLVRLAYMKGFRGIEVCDRHIHLDDRDSTPVLLWGKSK